MIKCIVQNSDYLYGIFFYIALLYDDIHQNHIGFILKLIIVLALIRSILLFYRKVVISNKSTSDCTFFRSLNYVKEYTTRLFTSCISTILLLLLVIGANLNFNYNYCVTFTVVLSFALYYLFYGIIMLAQYFKLMKEQDCQ